MREKISEKLWDLIEKQYLANNKKSIQQSFASHLEHSQSKTRYTTTAVDCYKALAYTIRDRMIELWNDANQTYFNQNVKKVYYLSMEFLMGRALNNTLLNLGMLPTVSKALSDFGLSIDELAELEPDAGLGNGGLGRLAACFLDSMATLQLPGEGYGILYDYGIFEQQIKEGQQVEKPEHWLRAGYPWLIMRPEFEYKIHFNGRVEPSTWPDGRFRAIWKDTRTVMALPFDLPIPGYGCKTVNTLRLWSARATQDFDLEEFNVGDYVGAVQQKIASETISRVLYPKDDIPQGKELRLKQEYFFVSATIQDILRRHLVKNPGFENLPDKVAIQLNDTHPSLAIVELLRLLLDREGMDWEQAWDICVNTFAYTNHTVMPEALEVWPVSILESLLPRHLQLIYEINKRFLSSVKATFPDDGEKLRRMSLIQEQPWKAVRMANLSVVGSHTVNGVSKLHSSLVTSRLFPDFYQLSPEKFQNKTNGITPRRWLKLANPELASLIESKIGKKWIKDAAQLAQLKPLHDDPSFQQEWLHVKEINKQRMADYIAAKTGVEVDIRSIFDVQIKRIHEYKRQLLNVLHILALYRRVINGDTQIFPRTFIFSGKAAPGYTMAKLIIRLINDVARLVNDDPRVRSVIKVVFIPNYNVSSAQIIIPAAEVSEQISTAGMEASGTGNMKLALNGALTIGTLDGANIEIQEQVGEDNIYIFGLTAQQVVELKTQGYNPWSTYAHDDELNAVIDFVHQGGVSPDEPHRYDPIIQSLLNGGDTYMVLADFREYMDCQAKIAADYADRPLWASRSILNSASMGWFSSDRTIQQYAEEIWRVKPVKPKKAGGGH